MWSVLSGYLEDNWGDRVSCQLEGGWCEMTVSLAVISWYLSVKGDCAVVELTRIQPLDIRRTVTT
jgi:hypothetical protein